MKVGLWFLVFAALVTRAAFSADIILFVYNDDPAQFVDHFDTRHEFEVRGVRSSLERLGVDADVVPVAASNLTQFAEHLSIAPGDRVRGVVFTGHASSTTFTLSTGGSYSGEQMGAAVARALARVPVAPNLVFTFSAPSTGTSYTNAMPFHEAFARSFREEAGAATALDRVTTIGHRYLTSGSSSLPMTRLQEIARATGIPHFVERLGQRFLFNDRDRASVHAYRHLTALMGLVPGTIISSAILMSITHHPETAVMIPSAIAAFIGGHVAITKSHLVTNKEVSLLTAGAGGDIEELHTSLNNAWAMAFGRPEGLDGCAIVYSRMGQ